MFLSHMKSRSKALFTAAALGIAASSVTAAPPPGMRWSDHSGTGSSVRGSSAPPGAMTRSYAPSTTYSAPAMSVAPSVGYAATAPSTIVSPAPAAGTSMAIRGPDGILRSYPMAGGTTIVQSQPAMPGFATVPAPTTGTTMAIRGPDGVLRSYPLAGGATVVQTQPSILNTAPTSYISVRGADGVLRYYPVVSGPVISSPR